MINDKNTDVAEVMETFLKHLKKWLPPREYTRCVWLLDQQRFTELHLYVARRREIASRVSDRVKSQAVGDIPLERSLHVRRYEAAANKYVHTTDALIALRRYIWAKFGLEVLLDVMNAWEYRDVG